MPTEPSEFSTTWAESGDNIAPTASQEDLGFQIRGSTDFPEGRPPRQLLNYLRRALFRMANWLHQSRWRPLAFFTNNQILHGDSALPSEFITPPGVIVPIWSGTRSTTLPADWLTSSGIILGNPVVRIGSLAIVLPDLSDVYVDLGDDGVIDFNAVGNGAGAPALVSGHIRIMILITDGAATITDGTYQWPGYISNSIRLNAVMHDANMGATGDYSYLAARSITRQASAVSFTVGTNSAGVVLYENVTSNPGFGGLTGSTISVEMFFDIAAFVPDGSVLDAAVVRSFCPAGSDLECQIFRRSKTANSAASMWTGGDHETISSVGSSGIPGSTALTLNESIGIRTVDYSAFSYFIYCRIPSGTLTGQVFYGVDVTYLVTSLGG